MTLSIGEFRKFARSFLLMMLLGGVYAVPAATVQHDPSLHTPPTPQAGNKTSLRVVGNVFFHFPGLDMTTLTPRQRNRFLQRINAEHCTCGSCTQDPVGHCYINDPGCKSVRLQAQAIMNEVKAGK